MNSKEYKFSDGRTAVFEYDENGIGKITLECMDVLMGMIPQWIPCSERLPKTNGVYIVARWFGDGCEKRILSDACYFDGSDTWYDDTRLNHGREYVTHKIVAWMPLPPAWKGE